MEKGSPKRCAPAAISSATKRRAKLATEAICSARARSNGKRKTSALTVCSLESWKGSMLYTWDLIGHEWLECLYALFNPEFERRVNRIMAEAIESWLERDRVNRPCRSCGRENDGYTSACALAHPDPGSVSICWYCASVSIFTDELELRAPTDAEMTLMMQDEQIWRIVLSIRAYRVDHPPRPLTDSERDPRM
jgi:hypothetical protein